MLSFAWLECVVCLLGGCFVLCLLSLYGRSFACMLGRFSSAKGPLVGRKRGTSPAAGRKVGKGG